MTTPTRPRVKLDRVILLFLFALFVLASPAVMLWASAENPWYLPYLLWLALIGLVAGMYGRGERRDL